MFSWTLFLVISPLTPIYETVSLVVYEQLSGKTYLGFPVKRYYHQCKMGRLDDVKYVMQGVVILTGMVILFVTRKVVAPFNESTWMYS
jgi:hypothetical protein